MEKKYTLSHLDVDEYDDEAIEKERKKLLEERDDLFQQLQKQTKESSQYKRMIEINNILNIKMEQFSQEDIKKETEMAYREITKEQFIEIANSYNDEKKYIQLLKAYSGYKNEWKLYTRTDVDSDMYYYFKAKFILKNYREDYLYFMNTVYRGRTKYCDKDFATYFNKFILKKKLKGMSTDEYIFRYSNLDFLLRMYEIPELADYSQLIELAFLCQLSETNLATFKEISTGSVENDLKNLYKALGKVLKDREKNFMLGKEFLERKQMAVENIEKDELIRTIGMLQERIEVLKKFTPETKKKK